MSLTRPSEEAQRRKAWGEPPPDAVPSVVHPRPHGRSAFTADLQAHTRRRMRSAPPPDAASSVVHPRPHGRSAFTAVVQAHTRRRMRSVTQPAMARRALPAWI